jgi:hypothetical protein
MLAAGIILQKLDGAKTDVALQTAAKDAIMVLSGHTGEPGFRKG